MNRLSLGIKIIATFALLGGVVIFLLTNSGASEAFVYSKKVDEVMSTPGRFSQRRLRVEGVLKQGTVSFREKPCEWRFVIKGQNHALRVHFPQCVVPDTFRDDMNVSVTVQGQLKTNKVFLADQVIAKCPSKYEMKERFDQGEAIPHKMP